MGFISRQVLPACTNMCVCCPALRSRSRHPVKRYKKLLGEIFPKSSDCPLNDRKIVKLCEYAAKNPFRIPKIAKYLEQRCSKELRTAHTRIITIILDTYDKLLCICKDQMAYFAMSLLNVVTELLDDRQQDNLQLLGCRTLTKFIYSQVDGTYTHSIEKLVPKVCYLACESGDEHNKRCLRAFSLQCLSAMIWFMTEFSHIFSEFDEIINVTLDNYGADALDDEDRADSIHNWVDEVINSEGRSGMGGGSDVSPSYMALRSQPEVKDPSMLTREEIETPKVWAQICIQNLVGLAKESTTVRRLLDPVCTYFDTGRHWNPQNGLAVRVLSDISYFIEGPGNKQLILSATIRHLDHKNVSHDPHIKSDVIQTATNLARQLGLQAIVVDLGVVSDLCRHLKKSLDATTEVVGQQETSWNITLQNSIEGCLLEIAKGVSNVRPLLDMMGIMLEKLPPVGVISRSLIDSLLILAHTISLASASSYPQQVFPEVLLLHLMKAMVHPDVEARIGAHYIFAILLTPPSDHPTRGNFSENRRWQSKTTSAIASATALLEKLRREKECTCTDKHVTGTREGHREEATEDDRKLGWARKKSPNFYKINSAATMERVSGFGSSLESGAKFLKLTEDQMFQLLSAFWLHANLPDNVPANFEAIAHSYNLTLLSFNTKKSNHSLAVRFFQLPISLRNVSLNLNALSPSCQRSCFTLSTSMLLFAAKSYQILELNDFLKSSISSDGDPYLYVGDDMQLYLKPQADRGDYGSSMDQHGALELLMQLKVIAVESEKAVLEILARSLSYETEMDVEEISKQLSQAFTPDDTFLFGLQSVTELNWIQALAVSKNSASFDEDSLPSPSTEDDAGGEISVGNFARILNNDNSSSFSQIVGVGKVLESALEVAGQVAGSSISTTPLPYSAMASQCEALGFGTRKKLSTWLGGDLKMDKLLPAFTPDGQMALSKISLGGTEEGTTKCPESWRALKLPPASPYDNFLKAAGC